MFTLLRNWLNSIELHNKLHAKLLCWLIPATCPFARDLKLGNAVWHVPPLCKINPVYEQLIALRFRALVYLEQHSY